MLYQAIITTPIGKIGLKTEADCLVKIEFLGPDLTDLKPTQPLAAVVVKQLHAYFKQPNFVFDIPVQLNTGKFQQQVLHQLQQIPRGEVISYGVLAKQLKTCAQAIGQACRRNPIPIVIPCHRVVAKDHLGGFSGARDGAMLDIKRWLLQHEQQNAY